LQDDPDSCLTDVVNIITKNIEKHFPVCLPSKKQNKRFRKRWMTQAILKSITEVKKLYSKYIQSKTNETKITNLENYQTRKKILKKVIRNAQSLDMKNDFDECAGDSTKTWKVLNNIFNPGKNKQQTKTIELRNEDGQIERNPQVNANKLNTHFVEKRMKFAKEIPQSNLPFNKYMGPRKANSIPTTKITKNEIIDIIDSLKTNKASGHDKISPKIIKWLRDPLAILLEKIYNKFYMEEGKYPQSCKIAKVTPLPKGGDDHDCDNYRPISVLSQLNKIFEKVLHNRLETFLTKNKILTNFQFGFRKGHNTSHGITHLNEKIVEQLEKKRLCLALFIDLKSAFDTIDPKILVKKLDHIGIRGKMLEVLESYLNGRKQFVRNGDVDSILLDVLIGVPQGSVLGPLLFIIYFNDIVNVSKKLGSALFADDAVLVAHEKNLKLLQRTINQEMRLIHEWLVANKLTLNLTKTKYMIFVGNNNNKLKTKLKKFKVNINNYCIKQVKEFKYLGVHVDESLTWQAHVEHLCTKLSKAAGIMFKLKNIAPRKILKTVYHSIVASHLRYGILAWGSANSTALQRLNNIHNRIIKNMKYSNETLEAAFKNLELMSITDLHQFELGKFIHKIKEGNAPETFDLTALTINHNYGTRARTAGNLGISRPRTEKGKTKLDYKGAKLWNSLPHYIKQITRHKTFIYELKKILLQDQSERILKVDYSII